MKSTWICLLVVAGISGGLALADVNSPYGINSHVPDNTTLDLVAGAGIGWIRVDMNWFQMEPGRDSYNWGFMDSVVNNARARGLEIFATLAYSPAWANGTGNIADPPLDTADWYDFVYDTVNRYKNSVKYWGMWNEPNLEDFFTGNGWQYREWILKPGAQAAKAADPTCLVLGPELAHLTSSDWPDWMEEAMIAGGADHIDIVSHHCYKGDTGNDIFKYLDADAGYWPWDPPPLMKVLENLGVDGKPVWLTEVTWYPKAFEPTRTTFVSPAVIFSTNATAPPSVCTHPVIARVSLGVGLAEGVGARTGVCEDGEAAFGRGGGDGVFGCRARLN